MGRTKRHDKDSGDDGTVNFRSKRKGQQSRKKRKGKANLQKAVSLRSERYVPSVPNEETLAAMDEIANGKLRTFDTVEEFLKELHEPDDT